MNKLILFLTVCLFLLFTSTIKADSIQSHTMSSIETVSQVWYDSTQHEYMIDTERQNNNQIGWTIELIKVDHYNEQTLNLLKSIYEHRQLKLTYTGVSSMPDDWEIIDYRMID